MKVLGPTDTLRCPIDDLEFRPYYTDGQCPIDGWRPEDVVVRRPWWQAADPVVAVFVAMVVVSLVMGIIVVAAYLS